RGRAVRRARDRREVEADPHGRILPGGRPFMTTQLDDLLNTRVARFVDRQPDWDAFADARVEGFRRAQHRYIGSGASGKTDARAIPAEQFTLRPLRGPPGRGKA